MNKYEIALEIWKEWDDKKYPYFNEWLLDKITDMEEDEKDTVCPNCNYAHERVGEYLRCKCSFSKYE